MFETLVDQVEAIRAGRLTPVDLVEHALARIDRVEPDVHAFATLMADQARGEAAHLATIAPTGRLHGVPVAVKDIIHAHGAPTQANSAALAGFVPDHEATVVARLRAEGAIVVGKTNTHELAYGTSCPASFNPYDTTRMTGGSSGGNGAAVGAGIVAGTVGTDTGGSVRLPASYCGLSAIKPTAGAVPRDGVYLLSYTFDTVGPMARTAADCRLLLEIMAGRSVRDPYSVGATFGPVGPVARMRIGVPTAAYYDGLDVDDRVMNVVETAIGVLSGLVEEVVAVDPPHPSEVDPTIAVVAAEPCQLLAEVRADRGHLLGADVQALLEVGDAFTASDVVGGHHARVALQRRFASLFADRSIDAFISPITPNHVPAHGAVELNGVPLLRATTPFCLPVNAAWLPSIALQGGRADDGLPIGFQLVGPHWSDMGLAALGEAFQAATSHHLITPFS